MDKPQVLIRLDPEVYETLQSFGVENQFTVPYAARELFQLAFDQWQKGKIVLEPTKKSRRYFRSGQTQRQTISEKSRI
jgi:bifunctional DNA-binding transcriptional regulator/antitoxin component of YhaV-PrlF toxin-antitoxin module